MSIECEECEREARHGHALYCSRHPDNKYLCKECKNDIRHGHADGCSRMPPDPVWPSTVSVKHYDEGGGKLSETEHRRQFMGEWMPDQSISGLISHVKHSDSRRIAQELSHVYQMNEVLKRANGDLSGELNLAQEELAKAEKANSGLEKIRDDLRVDSSEKQTALIDLSNTLNLTKGKLVAAKYDVEQLTKINKKLGSQLVEAQKANEELSYNCNYLTATVKRLGIESKAKTKADHEVICNLVDKLAATKNANVVLKNHKDELREEIEAIEAEALSDYEKLETTIKLNKELSDNCDHLAGRLKTSDAINKQFVERAESDNNSLAWDDSLKRLADAQSDNVALSEAVKRLYKKLEVSEADNEIMNAALNELEDKAKRTLSTLSRFIR